MGLDVNSIFAKMSVNDIKHMCSWISAKICDIPVERASIHNVVATEYQNMCHMYLLIQVGQYRTINEFYYNLIVAKYSK